MKLLKIWIVLFTITIIFNLTTLIKWEIAEYNAQDYVPTTISATETEEETSIPTYPDDMQETYTVTVHIAGQSVELHSLDATGSECSSGYSIEGECINYEIGADGLAYVSNQDSEWYGYPIAVVSKPVKEVIGHDDLVIVGKTSFVIVDQPSCYDGDCNTERYQVEILHQSDSIKSATMNNRQKNVAGDDFDWHKEVELPVEEE